MTPANNSLYDQAVKISEDYLGPAGERFIRRQIVTHIDIKPEALRKKDVPQLVNWVGLAFALLTNDKQEIDSFTMQLMKLGEGSSKERSHAKDHD